LHSQLGEGARILARSAAGEQRGASPSHTAHLTAVICFAVPQPPTITKQSVKDYIVDPRDNIFIECEAKGNPVPT